MLRFARTIDNTPHHSYFHLLDTRVFFTPDWHLVAQIGLNLIRHVLEKSTGGAATTGARSHLRREATEIQRLENLLAHDHFFSAIPVRQGSKRGPDSVPDSRLQQDRDCGGSGYDSFRAEAGLGEAQVQWVVAACSKHFIHMDQVLHI